jgi:hypothetical protein
MDFISLLLRTGEPVAGDGTLRLDCESDVLIDPTEMRRALAEKKARY